jgi:hypothetical protein
MIMIWVVAIISPASPVIGWAMIGVDIVMPYHGIAVIVDLDVLTVINVDVYVIASFVDIHLIVAYIAHLVVAVFGRYSLFLGAGCSCTGWLFGCSRL